MSTQSTILGRLIKTKTLPSNSEILGSVGNLLKKAKINPVKAIKDGIARDKYAIEAMKSATGMTRKQVATQLGTALAKGVYKGGGKDLAVNTGGLLGSIGGKAGGLTGQLAGDWGGAAITRKALDDTEALTRTIKQAKKYNKNSHYQALPSVKKAEVLRRTLIKQANQTKTRFKEDIKNDTLGWAIGNASAETLKAAGSNVPLQGGTIALGTMPSIKRGIKVAKRTQNIHKGNVAAVRDLNRRYNIKRKINEGFDRENKMRESINKQLQKLPTLPPHVNFKYFNTLIY